MRAKNNNVSSGDCFHIKELGFTNPGVFFDREEEIVFVDYVPKLSIPNSLGN